MLASVLIILYEISIFSVRMIERKRSVEMDEGEQAEPNENANYTSDI